MAGNIREGATIFGVAGGSKQASGNAVAGDVLLNKTFSNDGRGGAHREHAEPRRRDPDAGAGGRRDRRRGITMVPAQSSGTRT